MSASAPTGVLLINLGTPDAPTTPAVRRYLRQFLMDPRVLDLPLVARWLLVHGVILPRRPRLSADAYRAIWTDAGSPLLVHSQGLRRALQEILGGEFRVELGMRYGNPSIESAVRALRRAGADELVAVPLFPQSADASTGSAVAELHRVLEPGAARRLRVVPAFYDDPGFIEAYRSVVEPPLRAFDADHVLMSYHGLPERQVRKTDPSGGHCFAREDCCATVAGPAAHCYRAQCFATTRALRAALHLPEDRVGTSFQSRLGRTPWIRPFTDEVLPELAERGVRRLAVACPSFVADCLETIEEIGIRAREQWRSVGGEALELLPCPNADPALARAVAGWVRGALGSGTSRAQTPTAAAAATAPATQSATETPSV